MKIKSQTTIGFWCLVFAWALIFGVCGFAGTASAARLYFAPASGNFSVGSYTALDIMLDPEGEAINGVELSVAFPGQILGYKSAATDDSIISYWILSPKQEGGLIKMAGIAPGGFAGLLVPGDSKMYPGKISTLIFRTQKDGSGQIVLRDVKVTKNNEKGDLAAATLEAFNFATTASTNAPDTKAEGEGSSYDYHDTVPPEIFSPVVIKSDYLFSGKYALVFQTSDSGSGVEHYEVREGEKADFRRAESPYLLENQDLGDIIYVRAIDYAGNARTVSLPAGKRDGRFLSLSNPTIIALVIIALVLIILIWIIGRRRRLPS